MQVLFDDLGHQVQACRDLRGIPLIQLVTVFLRHDIRPEALRQTRQRVSHWRDTRGIGPL